MDFVCLDKKLVIELDGKGHLEELQERYDQKRTEYLESEGFKVLRFWNSEVLNDSEKIQKRIMEELDRF